jgi:hypothetical protein
MTILESYNEAARALTSALAHNEYSLVHHCAEELAHWAKLMEEDERLAKDKNTEKALPF